MKYLWTEDTGAGLHFWKLVNQLLGECWYQDCCVSEHPDHGKCGKPEVEDGAEKMRILIQSEEVKKIIEKIK